MEDLMQAIRRLTRLAQTGPVTSDVWQEGIQLYERVRTSSMNPSAKSETLAQLQVYPEAGLFYIAAKQLWVENPKAASWIDQDMRIYARRGVDGVMEANMEILKQGLRPRAPQYLRENPGVQRWLDEQVLRVFCAAQVNLGRPVFLSDAEFGMISARLGRAAVERVLREVMDM